MGDILLYDLQQMGCNVDAAMHRVGDDEDFYIGCLEDFINDEVFGKLDACIAESDIDGAFNYAHELKGVSGNLGLIPIYNTVCDMVETIRNGSLAGVRDKYNLLMDNVNALSAKLG